MSSQNNATPSPKKVAFSPVRVGSAELQCHSMTPPQSKRGTAGTPRSILKISNSPIYSHENDVSIVLDSSTGTGLGSQEEIISLETCIQNLLVAKEEDRLHTYSALYNALKSGDNSTGIDEGMLRSVVKIILKDMESSSSIVIKQTSFRCMGFVLNYSTLVNGLAAVDISSTLNTIVKIMNDTQAKSIYTLCIWCLAMQRISKKILDPHVPLLVKSAIAAVSPRLKSAKAQMEALAALDVIFTQDPNRFATWANCCFCTITQCFTNSLAPVRKRAAVILSKMLPKIWGEPALLSSAIQIFLRDYATKFTDDMLKMIEDSPEDQDIMQLWALMVMVTGTSLHRSRFLNGMIRVAEKSFQCRRSDANINTFKAWSALIYNFRLKNHLLHENRLKLVKLPLEAGLKEEKHLSVRVAATKAWMSLVYACNEDFNQTFVFNSVVRDMAAILSKDKSPVILDLLLQTLTALMNGHNRKVNKVSAVTVYFRQSDVQTADILPLSPALIRDHQRVIMDVFKAGLRHAIVRLDTRSDLSIKKSYMEAWQAMLRTYRDLYQKEIRPSIAYIQAIHSCLNFLAFVILGEQSDQQGFKEQLFIFKHLLKAMIDTLGPEFLTLRSFELSIKSHLRDDVVGSESMRQLNMVPIVFCLSIFIVLLCNNRRQAYHEYIETVVELSGACRQSSESFLDFVSLLECDFPRLDCNDDSEGRKEIYCSQEGKEYCDTLEVKMKMAKTCIHHEFGSLHGIKCVLPQTEEVKEALSRLICYPIRYMCSNGETPGPVMNSKWHGLANDIFNYMPDGISDIARNIHYIIERAFTSLPNAHPHESLCWWLDFCSAQLKQCYDPSVGEDTDAALDTANQTVVQLGFISVHEQIPHIIVNQAFNLESLHLDLKRISVYLTNVVCSLTRSNLDGKTLAAIAIRHMSAWQKALCGIKDSSMSPKDFRDTITELLGFIDTLMCLLQKLPVDEHTLELWAQSMAALVRSNNPLISDPFVAKLKEPEYASSIAKHSNVEQALISIGVVKPLSGSELFKASPTTITKGTYQSSIPSPTQTAVLDSTAMNCDDEILERISSRQVDQESTKNTLYTPPRKRPRNAGNKATDVVDLTSISPKRAKPTHEISGTESNPSWSPKPTLARKTVEGPSERKNVSSLLQKAVEEKSELDRMEVSDLLSCQQLLNQLNTLITETLAKTLK